jgi:hypothetical protein
MNSYKNLSGQSGVLGYELADNAILVQFKDGWKYRYTATSAGVSNILAMHDLAIAGSGLNSFINRCVRRNYAEKYL